MFQTDKPTTESILSAIISSLVLLYWLKKYILPEVRKKTCESKDSNSNGLSPANEIGKEIIETPIYDFQAGSDSENPTPVSKQTYV